MAVTEAPAPAQADTTATVVIEQPISAPPAPTNAVEQANVDRRAFNRSQRDTSRAPEAPKEPQAAEPSKTPAPVSAQPVAEEPRATSKRQQQINEYERTIAELNQRLQKLETAPPSQPAAQTPPEKIAESKRIASMPDYPKLAPH